MSQTLPVAINLSPDKGISAYVRSVNALPVLTADEERSLAVRFHTDNDLDAARQLVMGNLRYVVRIARDYAGYGLPQADLIQEGNIGLMKAVKHFDPDRKVRLMSFAVHWIKAEIYDYILRNWRIVKIATTKAQRKLFFNLRKSRARLGWMNPDEVAQLSERLNVAPETVREMEARLASPDVAFDGEPNEDEDTFHAAPAGYLQDLRFNPEQLVAKADHEDARDRNLKVALESLDDRARDIIQRRWLNEEKPTLHELAAEYGVSAERIRQIEARALATMKDVLAA
jgi:RNA polymerase sigma-32 factor